MIKLINAIIAFALSLTMGTQNQSNVQVKEFPIGSEISSQVETTEETNLATNQAVTVGAQQAVYEKYANGQKTAYTSGWVKYGAKYEYISENTRMFRNYEIFKDGRYFRFRGCDYVGTAKEVYLRGDRAIYFYNGGSSIWDDTSDIIIKGFARDYDSDARKVTLSWTDNGGQDYTYTPYISEILVDAQGIYLNDITSNNGAFPTGIKHTDGFWYVLKNLVED